VKDEIVGGDLSVYQAAHILPDERLMRQHCAFGR
jgi:hypothetical protein